MFRSRKKIFTLRTLGRGTGSYVKMVESLSLITTREFSLLLFIVVRLYYTSDRKYFYICKILRVCSFKWYDHGLSSSRNSGEISGLRSGTSSVVIRSSFPNNDSQPFFVPNNDTLTKFKGKHISLKKKPFFMFPVGNQAKVSLALL